MYIINLDLLRHIMGSHDRAFTKGHLREVYSKCLHYPLRKEALKRLQHCKCDALGGDECKCREPLAEPNGELSASTGSCCKLGPAPSPAPIEKDVHVTSSCGASNQVENGVAHHRSHKLFRDDTVTVGMYSELPVLNIAEQYQTDQTE